MTRTELIRRLNALVKEIDDGLKYAAKVGDDLHDDACRWAGRYGAAQSTAQVAKVRAQSILQALDSEASEWESLLPISEQDGLPVREVRQ